MGISRKAGPNPFLIPGEGRAKLYLKSLENRHA